MDTVCLYACKYVAFFVKTLKKSKSVIFDLFDVVYCNAFVEVKVSRTGGRGFPHRSSMDKNRL